MGIISMAITLFLLLMVLAMQFQMSQMNRKVDELLRRQTE